MDLTRQQNPPRLHRLGNILEGLRSHIITDDLDLTPDLPVGVVGHAYPARFGDPFKAGGNIDPIAVNVALLDDDIADIDTDAELDPVVFGNRRIAAGHGPLDFYSA